MRVLFQPKAEVPGIFGKARVAEGMTSLYGDLRDFTVLQDMVEAYQPEIVIHMAAQALVRRSYRDPLTTFSSNIMGTVNLFESCRKSQSVRCIVNVTSDKCYENREWVWGYREIDAMGGYDPYSCSKGCSELISNAYRRSFFDKTDIELIARTLGVEPKFKGNNYRFEVTNQENNYKLSVEIYPDIQIGAREGNLITVYAPCSHLQLLAISNSNRPLI